MRETDKLHGIVQHVLQIRQIQLSSLRIEGPFANRYAAISQAAPCARVCLMILVRDDDGVTTRQPFRRRMCQDIDVLRC